MAIWADYSAGRPGGAALRAAGFSGAIRYVGTPGRTKNITPGEYADLVAHGVAVLLVYENKTTDWQGGYNAGVANAQAAAIDAHNCGIPTSVGISASVDMHLTASQVSAAVQYAKGFRDALGQARAGAYGFIEFLQAVKSAGIGSWFWLAGTAPSAAIRSWATFWQRNAGITTKVVNGIACDINDEINTRFGASEETEVANTILPLTVDNANGRAYAVLTEGSNSAYFAGGFLDLVFLYGTNDSETQVRITFLHDDGSVAAEDSGTIAWNKRFFMALPDATAVVTVDWDVQTDGRVLAGSVELSSK